MALFDLSKIPYDAAVKIVTKGDFPAVANFCKASKLSKMMIEKNYPMQNMARYRIIKATEAWFALVKNHLHEFLENGKRKRAAAAGVAAVRLVVPVVPVVHREKRRQARREERMEEHESRRRLEPKKKKKISKKLELPSKKQAAKQYSKNVQPRGKNFPFRQ